MKKAQCAIGLAVPWGARSPCPFLTRPSMWTSGLEKRQTGACGQAVHRAWTTIEPLPTPCTRLVHTCPHYRACPRRHVQKKFQRKNFDWRIDVIAKASGGDGKLVEIARSGRSERGKLQRPHSRGPVNAILRTGVPTVSAKRFACKILRYLMKRSTLIKLVVSLVIVGVFAMWLRHQLRIDSCLDRGGRWNSEVSICEGATEH